MIANANRVTILTAFQAPKMERRMGRILAPQIVVLTGQILNIRRKRVQEVPKSPCCDGFHADGGHSRSSLSLDSLSASSNRKSSLPDAESLSNCRSQRSWPRSCTQRATRSNSSGGKLSMAASISSTLSITESLTQPGHVCLRESVPTITDGFDE
jgi:hypothetical protein